MGVLVEFGVICKEGGGRRGSGGGGLVGIEFGVDNVVLTALDGWWLSGSGGGKWSGILKFVLGSFKNK